MKALQESLQQSRDSRGHTGPQRGASMVEYCVLVALISIVALAAVQNLGWTIETTLVETAKAMSGGVH